MIHPGSPIKETASSLGVGNFSLSHLKTGWASAPLTMTFSMSRALVWKPKEEKKKDKLSIVLVLLLL